MRAYKFLDTEGRAPFTLTPWVPGRWIEAASAVPCHEGVHACRPADLSYWLAPTLWEIELEEPVVGTRHKLTARRGRVTAPVDRYPAAARELSAVCAWRCRDRAVTALQAASEDELAFRFAAAATLEELRRLLSAVDDSTSTGTAAALAADAAKFAITGPITEAPFIGACSAGHAAAGLDGDQSVFDAAYAEERAWQSAWLAATLHLSGH